MPTTRKRGKPTELENAGRTVRRAANLIEDRGWVRGGLGTDATGMCVRGAICRALTGSQTQDTPVAKRTEALFGQFLGPHFTGEYYTFDHGSGPVSIIPPWNDAPDRTKEEVLQWMYKFADEADPQRP